MQTTPQQERTAIIILNALTVCVLAAGYYNHEFDGDTAIVFYRGAVPFVAFALVLVRLVVFAEHVLLHDAQIYTSNGSKTTATLSSQMKTYQTALLLGHGLFALTLLLELWGVVQPARGSGGYVVLTALVASLALQAAEAWAYQCDVKRESDHRVRPASPHSMV